jgi:hypothetical protein
VPKQPPPNQFSELPVVSTSSTTDLLPELVEGSSGDFSAPAPIYLGYFLLVEAKESK